MTGIKKTGFQVFNQTVRGYSHQRKGIVCEDDSLSCRDENFAIGVCCDGHGDPACFRSELGSSFAAQAALSALRSFAFALIDNPELYENFALLKYRKQMLLQLTNALIEQWHERLERDLKDHPVTEEQLGGAGLCANFYRRGKRLAHIYGTTLLAALQIEDYLILLQQGDGRIMVLSESGHFTEPVPWDSRCYENITTSLCDEDAPESIRTAVIDLTKTSVAGVYLATDGIEDSFYDPEGRYSFLKDLSVLVNEHHLNDLPDRLRELSRNGSGDDISLAILYRPESIYALEESFSKAYRRYRLLSMKQDYEQKLKSMQRKHDYLRAQAGNPDLKKQDHETDLKKQEIEALEGDLRLLRRLQSGKRTSLSYFLPGQKLMPKDRRIGKKLSFKLTDSVREDLNQMISDLNSKIEHEKKLYHDNVSAKRIGDKKRASDYEEYAAYHARYEAVKEKLNQINVELNKS